MCLGKRKVHDYDFSIVERRRFEAENFCLHSIYKLNTARGAVTKYFKVEEFDPREDESVKKWSEWYAAESTSGKRSVSDSHGTISDGDCGSSTQGIKDSEALEKLQLKYLLPRIADIDEFLRQVDAILLPRQDPREEEEDEFFAIPLGIGSSQRVDDGVMVFDTTDGAESLPFTSEVMVRPDRYRDQSDDEEEVGNPWISRQRNRRQRRRRSNGNGSNRRHRDNTDGDPT